MWRWIKDAPAPARRVAESCWTDELARLRAAIAYDQRPTVTGAAARAPIDEREHSWLMEETEAREHYVLLAAPA
jgi:hypothetical protein